MLGAVTTDLVSPSALKRSTQNLSAIHKLPADYPIFAEEKRFILSEERTFLRQVL